MEKYKENNQVVAEFMGYTEGIYDHGINGVTPIWKNDSIREGHYRTLQEFKYHSSWDDLMPVIRKIWNLDCQHDRQDQHFNEMQNILPLAEMYSAYMSCVRFIQWYNEQNQTA
jgi:hypothetical protein